MARSLTADTLIEATVEELSTYLRSGSLNTQTLAHSLDYSGLNIEDWERIKRIHFCLSSDVRTFIAELPDRVRRIKTENQREHIETRGEVRGRINWGSTLRIWSETGYVDQSRYACDTPYTEYNIPENRVLQRLLWQIHRTVTNDLEDIEYDWRYDYWTDERINQFSRLYSQNVHLNRIPDGQHLSVSVQDLNTARQARLPLYTEAYELLDQYQRLQADIFDPDIVKLLAETLIIPTSEPRLFELFCVFRILRHFTPPEGGFELQPIEPSSDALARFTGPDRRIDVYHDRVGTLHFYEPIDTDREPSHPTFQRYQNALIDYSETLTALTGDEHEPILYSGRPDLIVEMYDTNGEDDRLVNVVIGEFKYSNATQTFKQGLEELITYRQFAKHDRYLVDDPSVSLTGILVTNGASTSEATQNITHVNGSDLLDETSQLTASILAGSNENL